MQKRGLILFDIDGVIRDVGNSYRLAVKETVLNFCGWEPKSLDIDMLKNEGIWNNDWDLSLEMIKRHIKKNNLSITPPLKKEVINLFEEFYFGCSSSEDYSKWNGFIKNEELLIDKNFFNDLNRMHINWGFVSGAELASAKYVLEKKLGLPSPPLIAMGDYPDKPNPDGFISLAKRLLPGEFCSESPPIAYVGDTIADVQTVLNARKKIPNQSFISVGIAPPHLRSKLLIKERQKYEMNLKNAGADFILKSIQQIKDIYLDLLETESQDKIL